MPDTSNVDTEWFSEEDLSKMKGFADESTIDSFIERFGGERIDKAHSNLEILNADYIFHKQKIIIELKTLENEVSNTDQFREKMKVAYRKIYSRSGKGPLSLDDEITKYYFKVFLDLFRPPLARIVKKANNQIRSTKENLGYADYRGIILIVNDNLKELPPLLMMATLGRILNGSCSSIRAMIYLTNHYVVMPGDEYGRILWAPLYADAEGDNLVDFVNELCSRWFTYCEGLGMPVDYRQVGRDISLDGSRAAGSEFPIS